MLDCDSTGTRLLRITAELSCEAARHEEVIADVLRALDGKPLISTPEQAKEAIAAALLYTQASLLYQKSVACTDS